MKNNGMLLQCGIKYFLIAIIIVISTTLVSERAAFADTVNWTGAGDGINWSDHNNWSTGMVPATSDTIIISPTSVHSVHLNVNFTLSSGGTITINPFNQLLVDPSHILLNFGSITVNAYTGGNLATLYIYKGGTVTNYGTITDKYLFSNFGTINNLGSIFVPGTMVNKFSGVINNGGTISSTSSLGQLENGGHITNSDTISLGENGMVNDASGIITNNNAGKVTFDNTNNYGAINNLGNVVSKGLVNWGTGTINNNAGGNFTTFVGGLTNYGTINNISGGNFNDHSSIANYNTINNNSGGNFTNNNVVTNYNTINNRGAFANYGSFSNLFDNTSLHFGIVNNYDTFKNFGTLNNNEYINNFAFFKNTASGNITNPGFINNICHGVLTNLGAISGNPVNNFPCNTTLTPDKDSYIVNDLPNANYGANSLLRIQQVKQIRTTISFDFLPLETIKVLQAKLRIFATSNGFNWGDGESIEAHKLTSTWAEGNGINAIIRGTGSGVTWNCPTDSNVTNQMFDCNSQWNGGSFVAIPTGMVPISNTTSGIWLEFNVTNDVNSFLDGNAADNSGWIIKKTNELTSGSMAFASRENSDTGHRPQLVLTFGS